MKLDSKQEFQQKVYNFEKFGRSTVENLSQLRIIIIKNNRRDLLGSFYKLKSDLKKLSGAGRSEINIDQLLNSLSIIGSEINQLKKAASLKVELEKENFETEEIVERVEKTVQVDLLDSDINKQIDRLHLISSEKYESILRTFDIVKFNFPEDVYGTCLETFNMISSNFKNIEISKAKISDKDKLYELQLQLAIVLEEFRIELEGYINEYNGLKKAVI